MAPMKRHHPILLYSVDDVVIYEGGNNCGATGNVSSERDATKDYAFLSLNSNIGNTLGYLGWTTSVSVGTQWL